MCAWGLPRQNTFARGPLRCCSSSAVVEVAVPRYCFWTYCLWILVSFIQSVVFKTVCGNAFKVPWSCQAAYYGHLNLVEYFVEKPRAWHRHQSTWPEGRRMAWPMMDKCSPSDSHNHSQSMPIYVNLYPAVVILKDSYDKHRSILLQCSASLQSQNTGLQPVFVHTWRVLSRILRLGARSHATWLLWYSFRVALTCYCTYRIL